MSSMSLAQIKSAITARNFRRMGPLGLIIFGHVGFLYALQSGLPQQAVKVEPSKEIQISFIVPINEPDKTPEPERPKPLPKIVPIVKKAVIAPPVVVPVVDIAPAEQLTAPPPAPEPKPTEKAEPIVEAPPAPVVPPAPPAQIKMITSGVEYIQPPQPIYPVASRRMGEEGKVLLRVLISEQGRPERADIQKSSGSTRLDDAAKKAVLQTLFKPYIEGGRALTVYAMVPIIFSLR